MGRHCRLMTEKTMTSLGPCNRYNTDSLHVTRSDYGVGGNGEHLVRSRLHNALQPLFGIYCTGYPFDG